MVAKRAMKPIVEEIKTLMERRGWRAIDVYANGGPSPDTVSRYGAGKRGRVAEPRTIPTLRKFEDAFALPEGYFLEEQLYNAEEILRVLVREGFIRLSDLRALIAAGQAEKKARERSDAQ
jgi:hypothetical protein